MCWLQKGSEIKVKTRCLVEFSIGKYQDAVWCDVASMDACHLLLGRPWQYDCRVIYDGLKKTYTFNNNGNKIVLTLLKPIVPLEPKKEKRVMLISRTELEKEYKKVIGKDLRSHLEDESKTDLRTSLGFQPWRIDTRVLAQNDLKKILEQRGSDVATRGYWLF